MKGILADRNTGLQLLSLFLLSVMGYIFFSGIGLTLASSVYNIEVDDIAGLMSNLPEGSAHVIRMIQGFSTLGLFLFPALMGAYMISHHPERLLSIDFFPRPAWLFILILPVLAYSSGIISDALYQLSLQFNWPESLSFIEEYFNESAELVTQQYQVLLQMDSFTEFLQVIIVMALLPAVAEEALFRGVMQPLLIRSSGRHYGIILTSLLFALLHQQFLAFLSIFALGILLGYLKHWTQSLWVPTLVHFVNNAAIVVMVYFFDLNYADPTESSSLQQPASMLVLGAIFVICLLLVHRLSKNGSRGQ